MMIILSQLLLESMDFGDSSGLIIPPQTRQPAPVKPIANLLAPEGQRSVAARGPARARRIGVDADFLPPAWGRGAEPDLRLPCAKRFAS